MTFLWDIYKGSYRFTEKEERITKWFLQILIKECPKTCSFLLTLNIDELEFYWAPGMTIENGIAGAWCVTSPKHVYMRAIDDHLYSFRKSETIKDSETNSRMQSLFSTTNTVTLIHELIHMLQFKTSSILYFINRLSTLFVDRIPFLEQIGIEYDARTNSETEELIEFSKKWETCVSTYTVAILNRASSDENYLYKSWCENYPETSREGNKFRKLTLEYINMINE